MRHGVHSARGSGARRPGRARRGRLRDAGRRTFAVGHRGPDADDEHAARPDGACLVPRSCAGRPDRRGGVVQRQLRCRRPESDHWAVEGRCGCGRAAAASDRGRPGRRHREALERGTNACSAPDADPVGRAGARSGDGGEPAAERDPRRSRSRSRRRPRWVHYPPDVRCHRRRRGHAGDCLRGGPRTGRRLRDRKALPGSRLRTDQHRQRGIGGHRESRRTPHRPPSVPASGSPRDCRS